MNDRPYEKAFNAVAKIAPQNNEPKDWHKKLECLVQLIRNQNLRVVAIDSKGDDPANSLPILHPEFADALEFALKEKL